MPIIIPEATPDAKFYDRLSDAGAAMIPEDKAVHQDARPARIGLLNLMPAPVMEETELRWLQFISHTVLQIEPVLVKFDDDCRENYGSSREHILQRYQEFSEVRERGLDGLIITGANQELSPDKKSLLPFEELNYFKALSKIIDWANENTCSTIYSCLASHFALNMRYGLTRNLTSKKTFGIYRHDVIERDSELVFAMDDSIAAPHSRWGDINSETLASKALKVVAINQEAGWLLAEEPNNNNGSNVYIQGHPEYWRTDLHQEYQRDGTQMPEHYYPDNDSINRPILSWSNDARSLLSNWISRIYEQYSFTL